MNSHNLKLLLQEAWDAGRPPDLNDFLPPANHPERRDILRELVAEDVRIRKDIGAPVSSQEYSHCGQDACEIARQILESTKDSTALTQFLPSRIDPTAATVGSFEVESFQRTQDSPSAGRMIGPYRLLERIGKGGMGTVWKAEQKDPVQRTVALKLIRGDLYADSAMTRFALERQAIARMDHPNIAKILDAGKTEDGSPFFVMELVEGMTLDQYCDKHKLDVRRRLALMVPVCKAMQHAHQKGIIHRDLKHSNVLVAEHDGQPIPKVIDFGLAKAFESQSGDLEETVLTQFGQVVGTIQYMSPEQAQGKEVDTRTDIYALGVMLYKLLVGSTPLAQEQLSSQSLVKLIDHIRNVDAPKPSSRLDSSGDKLEAIGERRATRPEKLRQLLKGDLDWIVMTAIDKDYERRYGTAQELASELERYLNNEEVMARPPSSIYRVKKFVKRNRTLVTGVTAAAFLLLAGIVGTSVGLVMALRATERANATSQQAKLEAERAHTAEVNADASRRNAEIQLYAVSVQSAWSNWQLGNIESAWETLLESQSDGWENRFLYSEFNTSKEVLYGHSRQLISVDVSPDGKTIATAGTDQTVKIWDATTRKLLRTELLEGAATSIQFSNDSRFLACADRSNYVSVWNLEESKRTYRERFPKDILATCFVTTNQDTGNQENTGKQENTGNQEEWQLAIGESDRDHVRDGLAWAYGSYSEPVIRILSSTGEITQELAGHAQSISCLTASQDGRILVSGDQSGDIRVWSLSNNHFAPETTSRRGHRGAVFDLTLSPDESLLASCGQDRIIQIQELKSGKFVSDIVGHQDVVSAVTFDSTGTKIASASYDRTARLWDLDGRELLVCRGHFGALNDIQFIGDEECVTVADDSTARIWGTDSKPSTRSLRPFGKLLWAGSFDPTGRRLACVSEDGGIQVICTKVSESLLETKTQTPQLTVDYAANGQWIATAGVTGQLEIRDPDTLEILSSIEAHQGYIWDVCFSPDSSRVVTAGAENVARVWRTSDWSLEAELRSHTSELASARFSPDGKSLVTSSDDMTVKLWNTSDFKLEHTFLGHKNSIWKAIFSACGRFVASSALDGEIILWDVACRKKLRSITGHSNQVAGLAFSPDGQRLASSSDDRTIRIWQVETGVELFVLRDPGDSPIVFVDFSADGQQLVSGNSAGWLTIRSSAEPGSTSAPYMPRRAVTFCSSAILDVIRKDISSDDLLKILADAKACCEHFPTYRSWMIRGIASYRLSKYLSAKLCLSEAARLEPIEYGEPDERPFIEGYLAMTDLMLGNLDAAAKNFAKFEAKCNLQIWANDEPVETLAKQVEAEFNRAAAKTNAGN